MKLLGLFLLVSVMVVVESGHTFLGTNVLRFMVYNETVEYSWKLLQKRVKEFKYQVPIGQEPRAIQGILAYDKTRTSASANVTAGGLGYDHVTIRMKSESSEKLHYDIYIYV